MPINPKPENDNNRRDDQEGLEPVQAQDDAHARHDGGREDENENLRVGNDHPGERQQDESAKHAYRLTRTAAFRKRLMA